MSSTEIIDVATGVVRFGGPLKEPRRNLQLITVGGHFQKILAIGGYNWLLTYNYNIDAIEEWNDDLETWKVNPTKLQKSRHGFGAVVVPKSSIC